MLTEKQSTHAPARTHTHTPPSLRYNEYDAPAQVSLLVMEIMFAPAQDGVAVGPTVVSTTVGSGVPSPPTGFGVPTGSSVITTTCCERGGGGGVRNMESAFER